MDPLNKDHILGLGAMAQVLQRGGRPENPYNAVVAAISLASAILECHRMPGLMQHQLASISEVHKLYAPDIYSLAEQFVRSINRHGYDKGEEITRVMDDILPLAFRFTGSDFDLDKDLEPREPSECMQDKYPDELVGFPVPLKLEVGRACVRNGLRTSGRVVVTPVSPVGDATMIFTDEHGQQHGPFPLDYKLPPLRTMGSRHPDLMGPIADQLKPGCGLIKDQFGRLPGHRFYNCGTPPDRNPAEQIYDSQRSFASTFDSLDQDVHGTQRIDPNAPDAYGRSSQDPYLTPMFPRSTRI